MHLLFQVVPPILYASDFSDLNAELQTYSWSVCALHSHSHYCVGPVRQTSPWWSKGKLWQTLKFKLCFLNELMFSNNFEIRRFTEFHKTLILVFVFIWGKEVSKCGTFRYHCFLKWLWTVFIYSQGSQMALWHGAYATAGEPDSSPMKSYWVLCQTVFHESIRKHLPQFLLWQRRR